MSRVSSGRRAGRLRAIAASIVVATTIAIALATMGSPSQQRQAKLDQRRVEDLHRIVRMAEVYARSNDALPPDLRTLASQPGQRLAITDPVDATPYAYEVTGTRSIRLCAVFATDTASATVERPLDDEWNHGVGWQCFDRTVRQEPPAERR